MGMVLSSGGCHRIPLGHLIALLLLWLRQGTLCLHQWRVLLIISRWILRLLLLLFIWQRWSRWLSYNWSSRYRLCSQLCLRLVEFDRIGSRHYWRVCLNHQIDSFAYLLNLALSLWGHRRATSSHYRLARGCLSLGIDSLLLRALRIGLATSSSRCLRLASPGCNLGHLREARDVRSWLVDVRGWHDSLLVAQLGLLLLAFLACLLHFYLHASWKNHLAQISLNFDDACFFQSRSNRIEVCQVLLELLLADIDDELLADTVSTHIFLNGRCMHILVGLDDLENILFFRAVPSVLNSQRCIVASLLQPLELVHADESAHVGLNLDCRPVLHHQLVPRLQLDQQLFLS